MNEDSTAAAIVSHSNPHCSFQRFHRASIAAAAAAAACVTLLLLLSTPTRRDDDNRYSVIVIVVSSMIIFVLFLLLLKFLYISLLLLSLSFLPTTYTLLHTCVLFGFPSTFLRSFVSASFS
eukprot:GHVU01132897.1.p1 GENE.GHVU01132897.1~~GHVU01132897.1.p1  ORF type:complete len:121 (-),score=8.84 GHVU01132897.1:236-598(-)